MSGNWKVPRSTGSGTFSSLPTARELSVLGNLFPSNGNRFGNWIFSDLELTTGKEVRQLKGPSAGNGLTQVVVSTDTTLIACKNPEDWAIHIQDIASGKEVLKFSAQENELPERFTAGGSRLISRGYTKNDYRIRDVAAGAEAGKLPSPEVILAPLGLPSGEKRTCLNPGAAALEGSS